MKALAPLEKSLASATKDLPHLPKGLRDWLVENAWWLTLIGVVLGAIAAFQLVGALIFVAGLTAAYLGAGYGALYIPSVVVSMAVLIATIVIEAMAIQPLKAKQKRGWDLVFLASVVSIVGSLVGSVIGGNIFGGIFMAAVSAVIGVYVLFELRPHYLGEKRASEKSAKE